MFIIKPLILRHTQAGQNLLKMAKLAIGISTFKRLMMPLIKKTIKKTIKQTSQKLLCLDLLATKG
ncbi:hypothetical protein AO368_1639 [Moraxella catarrhalis]|nr:hypothetical protein AO368_1639 [Moraxella catarrhalis]